MNIRRDKEGHYTMIKGSIQEEAITVVNIYAPIIGISGEGNGTPLQYSCLENPMDGGAWWLQSMGSLRVGYD